MVGGIVSHRRVFSFLILLLLALPRPGAAQQFITDDAELTDFGSCQLEAWHGERSSWILPACQLVRNFEIMAGWGTAVGGNGARTGRYLLQGKTVLLPLRPNRNGIALVAGVIHHPQRAYGTGSFTDAYAFVPLSASFADDAVMLHVNVGWHYDQGDHGGDPEFMHPHHSVIGSAKLNVTLTPRLLAVAETYAEGDILPGYQVGLRYWLVPDWLRTDISYGGHGMRGVVGEGIAIGIQVTPPPFR